MAIAMTCYAPLISDIQQQNSAKKHMLVTKQYIPGTAAVSMGSHTRRLTKVKDCTREACKPAP